MHKFTFAALTSRLFLAKIAHWFDTGTLPNSDAKIVQAAIKHFTQTNEPLPDHELKELGFTIARKELKQSNRLLTPKEINYYVAEAAEMTRRRRGMEFLSNDGLAMWLEGKYEDSINTLRQILMTGESSLREPLLYGQHFDCYTQQSAARINSPWRSLNRIIAGFEVGELYLLVAGPKEGKTTWLINAALGAAMTDRVLYITLEFKAPKIAKRLDARLLYLKENINLDRIMLHGHTIRTEIETGVAKEVQQLQGKIYIADLTGGEGTIPAIESLVQTAAEEGTPYKMVIVDYAGKIAVSKMKDETSKTKYIYDELFKMAQRQNVSLLSASQIDKTTQRALRQGELSALDASSVWGGIAGIADSSCAMTLHQTPRDERHDPPLATLTISYSRITSDRVSMKLIYKKERQFFGDYIPQEVLPPDAEADIGADEDATFDFGEEE